MKVMITNANMKRYFNKEVDAAISPDGKKAVFFNDAGDYEFLLDTDFVAVEDSNTLRDALKHKPRSIFIKY